MRYTIEDVEDELRCLGVSDVSDINQIENVIAQMEDSIRHTEDSLMLIEDRFQKEGIMADIQRRKEAIERFRQYIGMIKHSKEAE